MDDERRGQLPGQSDVYRGAADTRPDYWELPDRTGAETYPLSARALGCLRAAGIGTVRELTERSAQQLLTIPNFGQDSLRRTEMFLARHRLSLSETWQRSPKPEILPPAIDADVEEKLIAAGLWETEAAAGRPTPEVTLGGLVRVPGLSAGEVDGLVSFLAARGLLPRPSRSLAISRP